MSVTFKLPVCIHHRDHYEYFCESCLEPICRKCTILGPHNNQLHLVNHISEAYKTRVAEVSELIDSVLPHKRELLLAQVNRLEYRLDEVRLLKEQIEKRNTASEAELARNLVKAVEDKTTILKKFMQAINSELNQLNDWGHMYDEILALPDEKDRIVRLLGSFKKLETQLQLFVAKEIDPNINVFVEDLPKQLSEMRLELKKIQTYTQLNSTKVSLLERILAKRDIEVETNKVQLQEQMRTDLRYWRKETDTNIEELAKSILICHFCGNVFSKSVYNTACDKNVSNSDALLTTFKGYCKTPPEHTYLATERHYFGEVRDYSIISTAKQGGTNSMYATFLHALFFKLKIVFRNRSINPSKWLREHDSSSKGVVRSLDMQYLLRELCQMSERDTSAILKSMKSPTEGWVEYATFLERLTGQY